VTRRKAIHGGSVPASLLTTVTKNISKFSTLDFRSVDNADNKKYQIEQVK
jgi:hypothetical protein